MRRLSPDAADDTRANLRYLAGVAAVLAVLLGTGWAHHRQHTEGVADLTHAMWCDGNGLSTVQCALTQPNG